MLPHEMHFVPEQDLAAPVFVTLLYFYTICDMALLNQVRCKVDRGVEGTTPLLDRFNYADKRWEMSDRTFANARRLRQRAGAAAGPSSR